MMKSFQSWPHAKCIQLKYALLKSYAPNHYKHMCVIRTGSATSASSSWMVMSWSQVKAFSLLRINTFLQLRVKSCCRRTCRQGHSTWLLFRISYQGPRAAFPSTKLPIWSLYVGCFITWALWKHMGCDKQWHVKGIINDVSLSRLLVWSYFTHHCTGMSSGMFEYLLTIKIFFALDMIWHLIWLIFFGQISPSPNSHFFNII